MPTRSALLGFLAAVDSDARYAIYPAGRYSRVCVEDVDEAELSSEGRQFLGFIDDDSRRTECLGHPVLPLSVASVEWEPDVIIILRDDENESAARRIERLRGTGGLAGVRIVVQPVETLDAMTAHLGAYEPGCDYSSEFALRCRQMDRASEFAGHGASTLLCTMDGEVFLDASREQVAGYSGAVRELCHCLAGRGFSASLCVQLNDTPDGFGRTPDSVVAEVIDAFGVDAIELHGLDHNMSVEGYSAEWLIVGLEELHARFGVTSRYWAPPGWTVNWRTLAAVCDVPQIEAMRGLWSGPNRRQGTTVETFRFPYRTASIRQVPYTYADWMFMDYRCRETPTADLLSLHQELAQFAAAAPCLMETVVHPFRLAGPNLDARISMVDETLSMYADLGVRIAKVSEFLRTPADVSTGSCARIASR